VEPAHPVKPKRSLMGHRPGTPPATAGLRRCQVATPPWLVKLAWTILARARRRIGAVVDFGAGDGRFADAGHYSSYTGYEIDRRAPRRQASRVNARIRIGCILGVHTRYDAAIGNPPYVRNQDISTDWKQRARLLIRRETGIEPSQLSNLYVYFLWMMLLRTKPDGIVVAVVPKDWLHRPSAKELRRYIRMNRWTVSVFNLTGPICFDDGSVTSISICTIDKRILDRGVKTFDVHGTPPNVRYAELSDSAPAPSPYSNLRGQVYAARGISPGSQRAFVLTEKERTDAGIRKRDVVPCIPTLRPVPPNVRRLSNSVFYSLYVRGGRRCWLLRTNGATPLPGQVAAWLERVPIETRRNATCRSRAPWYRYAAPPPAPILYSNGFKGTLKPKIVLNQVGAICVGAVHGIFGTSNTGNARRLMKALERIDYRLATVPWASGLRKIEVGQMNALLTRLPLEPRRRK
jgi:hypothetical protein